MSHTHSYNSRLFSVQAVDAPTGLFESQWPSGTDSRYTQTPSAKSAGTVYSKGLISADLDAFGYHSIQHDTALLYVSNNLQTDVALWGQSEECYKVWDGG